MTDSALPPPNPPKFPVVLVPCLCALMRGDLPTSGGKVSCSSSLEMTLIVALWLDACAPSPPLPNDARIGVAFPGREAADVCGGKKLFVGFQVMMMAREEHVGVACVRCLEMMGLRAQPSPWSRTHRPVSTSIYHTLPHGALTGKMWLREVSACARLCSLPGDLDAALDVRRQAVRYGAFFVFLLFGQLRMRCASASFHFTRS